MSQRPFTPQRDLLGDLPDKIIASIFEYVQHGDREGLVLPFNTKLEEAEGVQDGLTEDEFFFLLDLYEQDGDQLLSDCLIIEALKGPPSTGGAPQYKAATDPFKTQREGYEMGVTSPPELQKAVTSLNKDLQQKAENEVKNLGKEFSDFHKEDMWYKTITGAVNQYKRARGQEPGEDPKFLERLLNIQEKKEQKALSKISMKERRHLVKVNRLVRQLNLARTGRDVRALKKQISIEKKKMDADREVQYRLFMRDRKKVLEKVREDYPGFWRGFLFGKKGMLKPDYGIGLLRRMGKVIKGAVVGWETDVDDFRAKKLRLGRETTKKEQAKYGAEIGPRVQQRRVPGAVQWVFGQRRLQAKEYGEKEPLEGAKAVPAVKRYMAKGGLPGSVWRGTGFTLFGKRFYTTDDWKDSKLGRKEAVHGMIHPWKERGLTGPEARRAMKIFMKDIKAVDAEIWKLKRDMKHQVQKPRGDGEKPYKDTEEYYAAMQRVKQLTRLRKQILSNKKTYIKYAKAAKSISKKLKKGKLKTADIMKTMKPLVPILGAAMVAAGVAWFKTRHSREMLRVATNKVLGEANKKGMYISAAEVRRAVKVVLKSPQKVREITHAIELARAGVAISKAANLLADIVIKDLGIDKMPTGRIPDLSPEPTTSGRHTGMLSAPKSLEPFSF